MRGSRSPVGTALPASRELVPALRQRRPAPVWAPRSVRALLLVIGLYILFPVGDVPLVDISLSAPLFALLFLEVMRRHVRWGYRSHRPLIRRATALTVILLLSWLVNLVAAGHALTGFDVGLGLRLPYWLLCMVLVSVVVASTQSPRVYIATLGWGIMALGLLRLGSAVFAGMWKVGRALALTQNTYGLLFSTFWPFALVVMLEGRRRQLRAGVGGVVLLMAVIINASRGSWVTVVCTTVLLGATVLKESPSFGGKLRRLAVLGVVAAVAAVGSVALLPHADRATYVERARSFQDLDQDASYQTRVAMRRKAAALFEQNPVLGVGPGRFSRISTEFDLPERLSGKSLVELNRKNSHSAYFQFLAETGLLGTASFVVLVGWLLLEGAGAALRLLRRGLLWPAGIYLGFLGMSAHLFVIAGLLGTLPWFIYGMVAGMIVWEKRMSRLAAAPPLQDAAKGRRWG